MRKSICIFLAVAALLGLIGCQDRNHKQDDSNLLPIITTPEETYTSFDGVDIRIAGITMEEDTTELRINWRNQTSHQVTYGEPYAIERLEGSQWVSCAKQDETVFITIGYLLEPGKETVKTYRISDLFDVSNPGTYRFKTTCYVAGKGKSEDCTLWAVFTIGDLENLGDGLVTGTKVDWHAQYIRTNGHQADGVFPRAQIINSLRELNDYYNLWHESFDLERKEKIYSDTTIGFLDACDSYDAAFFQENYLVFVLLEESSGSIRHEVRDVGRTEDQKLSISIDREVPEAVTADMAQWHIILEVSRDTAVQSQNDILVYLDGNLYWDGGPHYPVMPIAIKEQ